MIRVRCMMYGTKHTMYYEGYSSEGDALAMHRQLYSDSEHVYVLGATYITMDEYEADMVALRISREY